MLIYIDQKKITDDIIKLIAENLNESIIFSEKFYKLWQKRPELNTSLFSETKFVVQYYHPIFNFIDFLPQLLLKYEDKFSYQFINDRHNQENLTIKIICDKKFKFIYNLIFRPSQSKKYYITAKIISVL